jgi:hypothetical protein
MAIALLRGGSAAGCGADAPVDESLVPLAEGGADGALMDGTLVVDVIGADGVAVADAEVFLGAGATTRSVGRTGDDGRLVVRDPQLRGSLAVTVVAPAHTPTTWYGVTSEHVTIPLDRLGRAAPESVTIRGTIEGWDTLPALEAGRYRLAVVDYCRRPHLLSGRQVIPRAALASLPENTCFADDDGSRCAFTLQSRAGLQNLFAVIFEGDDAGTPADFADDSLDAVGYALLEGMAPAEGETLEGVVLEQLPAGTTFDTTLRSESIPGGLARAVASPGVALAPPRQMFYPALTGSAVGSFAVPTRSGPFDAAAFFAIAEATDEAGTARSVSVIRGIVGPSDITGPSDLVADRWLAAPAIAARSGTALVHGGPSDGTLHRATVTADGSGAAWKALILDRSPSVEPPRIEGLPTGAVNVRVVSADVPFDAAAFELDTLRQRIDHSSSRDSTLAGF